VILDGNFEVRVNGKAVAHAGPRTVAGAVCSGAQFRAEARWPAADGRVSIPSRCQSTLAALAPIILILRSMAGGAV